MRNWIILSHAEIRWRIAGITALLAISFCAVRFFKTWFLVGLSLMTNQYVIIPLGIAAWVVMLIAGIKWCRNKN